MEKIKWLLTTWGFFLVVGGAVLLNAVVYGDVLQFLWGMASVGAFMLFYPLVHKLNNRPQQFLLLAIKKE